MLVSLLDCAGVGSNSQKRTYEKHSKLLTFLIYEQTLLAPGTSAPSTEGKMSQNIIPTFSSRKALEKAFLAK